MNKNFISDFSSSLSQHGLTIGTRKYDVSISPVVAVDDTLNFSVWCKRNSDREVKFIEFRIVDMKVKSTAADTVHALEKTINEEY